jgi:hypothetical protein
MNGGQKMLAVTFCHFKKKRNVIHTLLSMGRITTPLLNVIMTVITMVTHSSLSGTL